MYIYCFDDIKGTGVNPAQEVPCRGEVLQNRSMTAIGVAQ